MSISAMTVSTVNNPELFKVLKYNSELWKGNISIAQFEFNTPNDLINYLKKKYEKIYFFRINMAKTFGGNWIKPKELYREDMTHETEPNCMMVSSKDSLMLITTKAKKAKEFVTFSSSAKNVYIPVMIYKDISNNIKFINF